MMLRRLSASCFVIVYAVVAGLIAGHIGSRRVRLGGLMLGIVLVISTVVSGRYVYRKHGLIK